MGKESRVLQGSHGSLWSVKLEDTSNSPVLWKDPVPDSDVGGEGAWAVQVSTKRAPPHPTLVTRQESSGARGSGRSTEKMM